MGVRLVPELVFKHCYEGVGVFEGASSWLGLDSVGRRLLVRALGHTGIVGG